MRCRHDYHRQQQHRAAAASCMVWSCVKKRRRVVVVTTREKGKNNALQRSVAERLGRRYRDREGQEGGTEDASEVSVVEIPVLRAVRLDDGCARMKRLVEESARNASLIYDWIIVTSPEGANVLAEVFPEAGGRRRGGESTSASSSSTAAAILPAIAVVGAATARNLENASGGGMRASFQPSIALGSALAAELPPCVRASENSRGRFRWGGGAGNEETKSRVLYCASRRAGNGIEEGLAARGFHVDRANTYTVDAVESLDLSALSAPDDVDDDGAMPVPPKAILAFASPSAVRYVLVLLLLPVIMNACSPASSRSCCVSFSKPFYRTERISNDAIRFRSAHTLRNSFPRTRT